MYIAAGPLAFARPPVVEKSLVGSVPPAGYDMQLDGADAAPEPHQRSGKVTPYFFSPTSPPFCVARASTTGRSV